MTTSTQWLRSSIGLATKQIHAPEAVLGLREEGEPGGTRGARMLSAVVLRENPAHDVLIDLHAECMRDLLGDALIAEPGVTRLEFDDSPDKVFGRALRAGLAPDSGGGEQAAIFPIDQRLVEAVITSPA